MTIEIANRLIEIRKRVGLSQEDLADKLGISRQAVSKWERAEASPDIDNLVALAKLYGVTMDDLLNTEKSVDEIFKEKDKADAWSDTSKFKKEEQTETVEGETVDDSEKEHSNEDKDKKEKFTSYFFDGEFDKLYQVKDSYKKRKKIFGIID